MVELNLLSSWDMASFTFILDFLYGFKCNYIFDELSGFIIIFYGSA
jgi:hypothetical protein